VVYISVLFPNSYVILFRGILFSFTLCTCPNQHNLCNLALSVRLCFLAFAKISLLTSSNFLFHCHILGLEFVYTLSFWEGHAVGHWLRHCATKRKVTGPVPDGVTGIFHWRNPSGCTMALGSTQSLNRNGYQEYFLVDGRLGLRLQGYHPITLRPLRYGPFVHCL
jgi:hypothetical protein